MLKLGDHVCIVQNYFVEYLRGAIGVISLPPDVVKTHDLNWRGYWREDRDLHGRKTRSYWVTFDELVYDPISLDHLIDAGAVSEEDLVRI